MKWHTLTQHGTSTTYQSGAWLLVQEQVGFGIYRVKAYRSGRLVREFAGERSLAESMAYAGREGE